ncbi:alkaline phosphatase family protein [Pedobacter sp. LMG 31464]|uniref:Alkaline phosphatase family protein n=1 Tax=Pedobacter planticolens TaxID=2679964 RepID=A0A923IWB1_9SPHI|nr:ectonucleotide pyrophosphatase/phosphodiesterase [Pedobacter planticolens]MBB2146941.1 alkaline phosphatase family protein [Pedobacter planticolens]
MLIKKLLFAVVLFTFLGITANAQDTTQKVVPNRVNGIEQQKKPYVILISIDAFRWDLADKYNAKNLIKLRESGVQAEYLKPSFPSLTFPNHYSIVTGLYPAHHGVVDNIFYDKTRNVIYKKSDKTMAADSSWYGGKPLWVLAEQQQMLSAIFYWPGSEISMDGIKPTYLYNYSEVIPIDKRVAVVKDWLQLPEEKRPHFIALYFPQVDQAAHRYKPESEETRKAVQIVDDAVGKLVDAAKSTGLHVNFILLSDHGMAAIDNVNTIPMPKAIDLTHFKVTPGNALLHIYANDKTFIKPTYKALKAEAKDYDVYLSKQIPKAWHYNKKADIYNRVGDILLVPHLPKVFNINGIRPDFGQHGFDPAIQDMHAVFYAWGPQFKQNLKISAFENVNVYPLIANILGLTYTQKIDGKAKVLAPILK